MNVITTRSFASLVVVAALMGGGCSSSSDESGATESVVAESSPAESVVAESAPAASGSTLRIGLSTTVLPGDPLKPIGDAIQAQFDEWNAAGGINGHQLELVVADGGMTPDAGAAAARKLVDKEGVVAMLGPQNPADCLTNRAYYEQTGVPVIGLNALACADSKVAFPISAEIGSSFPVIDAALTKKPNAKVAAVLVDVPTSREEIGVLTELVASRGASMALTEYVPFVGYDTTAIMVKLKAAKADVVYLSISPTDFPAFLTVANLQEVGPVQGVTWIGGLGAFSESVASAIGPDGEGMLGIDVTDDNAAGSAETADLWKKTFPDRPFGQEARGGFTLAGVLKQGIEATTGEVTRESLSTALAGLNEVSAPFLPGKIDYTQAPRIARLGVFQVTLNGGAWKEDGVLLAPVG
jgi:branched-chain amino acid transport system substrate-binding protein